MPWKRPFLWHNPFNRLHLQVKWHATNQQSMGGGHNRRKLAGEGAKRPPRRKISSKLFGTHRYKQQPEMPISSPKSLVLEVQSSGHGNPIPGRSPQKEESEPPGLPAGHEPLSNRACDQCSRCKQGHAQLRRCQENTFSKPVHCRATECDLPHFMPLARLKLEHRQLFANWSSRVGKRCRWLHSVCLTYPLHGPLRLGNLASACL